LSGIQHDSKHIPNIHIIFNFPPFVMDYLQGSTCIFCEAILRECGFRTGVFTSPHLIDVRERLRIDGLVIEWTNLSRCLIQYRHSIDLFFLSHFLIVFFSLTPTCTWYTHLPLLYHSAWTYGTDIWLMLVNHRIAKV